MTLNALSNALEPTGNGIESGFGGVLDMIRNDGIEPIAKGHAGALCGLPRSFPRRPVDAFHVPWNGVSHISPPGSSELDAPIPVLDRSTSSSESYPPPERATNRSKANLKEHGKEAVNGRNTLLTALSIGLPKRLLVTKFCRKFPEGSKPTLLVCRSDDHVVLRSVGGKFTMRTAGGAAS